MSTKSNLSALTGVLAPALFGLAALAVPSIAVAASCNPVPGAPSNPQTKCLAAIPITGNQVKSFDISFVNTQRNEYYLADRGTKGIDVIDTVHLTFVRTAGLDKPFKGIVLNAAGTAANNAKSGPAGVVAHGRWVYAGDGDSTLHVIDMQATPGSETQQVLSTGGQSRVDEMDLSTDGKFLLVANNADDPPFGTLYAANGDNATSTVTALKTILVDNSILPSGFGLGIEQPAWDPKTKRFYTSIPIIVDNPTGCNYGQKSGPVTCSGGLLVTDPNNPTAIQGAYDPVSNTGVIPLNACGPNGATVGPNDNLLLGCTPGNLPGSTTTLVINATTHNYAQVANIVGSDEVSYNAADNRYYLGASSAPKPAGSSSPLSRGSVMGVVDGTSVLIEGIPVSSGTHTLAADSVHNLVFVPEVYTTGPTAVPLGDQNFTAGSGSPTVSQLVCGTTDGCIAVYSSGNYTPPPAPPSGGGTTPPTAKTVAVANPKNATVNQKQFLLDGTGSTSADGKPLTYQWTLQAGSPTAGIFGATTATPTVQFFSGSGAYVFVLTVTDSSGTTATDTATLTYIAH